MWEFIQLGGWLMVPLLLVSVLSLTIIGERLWALQRRRNVPPNLVAHVWRGVKNNTLDSEQLRDIRSKSPLGRVVAAGLVNMHNERSVMMESISDAGRHEAHLLERYLNTLGTIAAVSPLLGLLGTVIGMIQVFSKASEVGLGSPEKLAGGIMEALITTAAGLIIAIPSLAAYRYFRGKVDALIVEMEKEALKLVEVIHGQRERVGSVRS